MSRSYFLVTLGCQMNLSDSQRIRTVLESMGYQSTEVEEEADLLGIVACSVRQKAIDKVYSRIHKWNEWKSRRSILTFVSGCMLDADAEKFLKRFDLVFTIAELPQLPEMIRQYGVPTAAVVRGGVDIREGFWQVDPTYTSSFEAYVPIQNGCDKFCTFCAVPYTRGREVSRPSGEILHEIGGLVDRGYRSITLLGQNVNSYGLDRRSKEIRFEELLRQIGQRTAGAELWIYFTSPHPRDMSEAVLEAVAEFPTLAKQIHLPLQSGDDKVLIRMNRNYRLDQYRTVAENVRRILPSATLFTDIIVGFSGETAEQFEHTRAALQEFAYNMAFIAAYSPRPGAASARWADDVPSEEKRRRLAVLTEVLRSSSGAHNAAMVGRTVRALVEGFDRKGFLSARTEGRIPLRINSTDAALIGRFVSVRVTAAHDLSLGAELARGEQTLGEQTLGEQTLGVRAV